MPEEKVVEQVEEKSQGQPVVDLMVNCEKHGEKSSAMQISLDGKRMGNYCFICFNDFLSVYLKNYV